MKIQQVKKQIPKIDFLFQSFLRKQDYCPHCGFNNCNISARKYVQIKIRECQKCHLYFTDPLYQPSFGANLYNKLYEAEGSTTALPSQDELTELKFNCFKSSDKFFGERINSIKSISNGCKLLELGSSWGYFLYQAKQKGFDVTGVEISNPRRLFGIEKLGVDIVSDINDLQNHSFDIVYTSHVLEHFLDISKIFAEINQRLKLGGSLIIEVPNFDFGAFGNQCLSIIGAIHPLGFSSKFFSQNLPDYGFKVAGFYDCWKSFPDGIKHKSHGNVVILLAEKIEDLS